MSLFDNGGQLPSGVSEVKAEKREAVLTLSAWTYLAESVQLMLEFLHRDPKFRRIVRKGKARETKRDRILARQVARATRYPDQAPPLLHKGKMNR